MGAGDGHNGGETVEAGLPNITGSTKYISANVPWQGTKDGAFEGYGSDSSVSIKDVALSGESRLGYYFKFNASKSNSIYGNSDTVQPPAYYVYMWRRAS